MLLVLSNMKSACIFVLMCSQAAAFVANPNGVQRYDAGRTSVILQQEQSISMPSHQKNKLSSFVNEFAPMAFMAAQGIATIIDPETSAKCGLFNGLDTANTRLIVLAGQVVSMVSDYAPSHSMVPDDMLFQHIMLCVTFKSFVDAVAPTVLSNFGETKSHSPANRNSKAFSSLFEKVGISWSQFESLSFDTLDWVTVQPGQTVDNNSEYAYWLYEGSIHVQTNEGSSNSNRVKQVLKVSSNDIGKGLLGAAELASCIENRDGCTGQSQSKVMFTAAEEGATLLRINSQELAKRMEHDQALGQSLRRVVMKGVQDKLSAFLKISKRS